MPLDAKRNKSLAFTRATLEEALQPFAPRIGKQYTKGRNFDRGLGQQCDVSILSTYLRRCLVCKQDAVATAVHGQSAGKFVQEINWRDHFEGWMKRHPVVWDHYKKGLNRELAVLDRDHGHCGRVQAAQAGQSAPDLFDSRAEEPMDTGYLQTHAHFSFTSIWIHSLELPWRLGDTQFATPCSLKGRFRAFVLKTKHALDKARIDLGEWRWDFDGAILPHATAAFFKDTKPIPAFVQNAELT